MRFTIDDLIDELHEEFPTVSRGSIKKICTRGINKAKWFVGKFFNFEVPIPGRSGRRAIIFRPMTQEKYNKLMAWRRKVRRGKQNEKTDA